MKYTLGFSPCPNDTFIFDALVNGKIKCELKFDTVIADVEELNRRAMTGEIDFVKISYHAYAQVAAQYLVCESGSALGRGNGPILVSKTKIYPDEIPFIEIAIPGEHTTAAFLLKYACPEVKIAGVYLFSDIEDAVLSGEADAGVLIHESRFTYARKGLQQIMDLGEYWENSTGQPIPLGCIAMNRNLPETTQRAFSAALKESVLFAKNNPASSYGYVKSHAWIRDDEITDRHIKMFVNKFTVELGEEGCQAVQFFLEKAKSLNIIESVPETIFLD
ncbi:MAG: 1,4-dihydroxy-6-naphthoate synthase [Prevotellaceae bacterium]|nr:1,4-dihydroxy-6-naphthoate synthase [Prevotellaceae bacterium]